MVMSAQWFPDLMNVKQKLQLFLESPDQHAAPGSPVITGSAPQFHLMSSSSFFFSPSRCVSVCSAQSRRNIPHVPPIILRTHREIHHSSSAHGLRLFPSERLKTQNKRCNYSIMSAVTLFYKFSKRCAPARLILAVAVR